MGERLIPFGSKVLFRCTNIPELVVAAELCEDVWTMDPPSVSHAKAGATVIANCSASDETTGKAGYREMLIAGQSARLVCAYIYANAGRASPPRILYSEDMTLSQKTEISSRSPSASKTE